MINLNEIASLLNLNDSINIKYLNRELILEEITGDKRDEIILKIIDKVYHGSLKQSGSHRYSEWEEGWNENLNKLSSTGEVEALIPGYFSTNSICRLGSKLFQANTPKAELSLLRVIQIDLFKQYASNASHIYEFGCGSGINLFNIRDTNVNSKITGLDWTTSSQKIIYEMINNGLLENVYAKNFNFFEPDYKFELDENSVVFTCAALEQIGDKWNNFVDYLINKKPRIVINIEPISELISNLKLLDFLSCEYSERRNYLKGYYNGLQDLEKNGIIKIIDRRSSSLGSIFINGYSIVVWEIV